MADVAGVNLGGPPSPRCWTGSTCAASSSPKGNQRKLRKQVRRLPWRRLREWHQAGLWQALH